MKTRIPKQDRARKAVDTLIEAAARILEGDSPADLTSNRIAERAGYSVGTFYEYFPNKQTLIRAISQREADRQVRLVHDALAAAPPEADASALIRIVLSAALRPFGTRTGLRRNMLRLALNDQVIFQMAADLQGRIMASLLRAFVDRGLLGATVNDVAAHTTLAAAVVGAIQQTALRRPETLETRHFEDDLTQIVLAWLTPAPSRKDR